MPRLMEGAKPRGVAAQRERTFVASPPTPAAPFTFSRRCGHTLRLLRYWAPQQKTTC